MFCPSFHSEAIHSRNLPINQTSVETFPGAACLRRFAVVYAPREISRDVFGTTQSGPPDIASGSLDDQAKSGSPPAMARVDAHFALPSIRYKPDASIR